MATRRNYGIVDAFAMRIVNYNDCVAIVEFFDSIRWAASVGTWDIRIWQGQTSVFILNVDRQTLRINIMGMDCIV